MATESLPHGPQKGGIFRRCQHPAKHWGLTKSALGHGVLALPFITSSLRVSKVQHFVPPLSPALFPLNQNLVLWKPASGLATTAV